MKTRLIPALGPQGAVRLHRRLVLRTLRIAEAACRACHAQLEARFDGANEAAMHHWLGDDFRCRPQVEGDLGKRMAGAFEDSFREGSRATIIIGTDCPGLTPQILATAFETLAQHPVVFGPATDGGYYLVGLVREIPELFRGIPWGSNRVLAESVQILKANGVTPGLLAQLDDIDRPEDLEVWRRLNEAESLGARQLSVIIPALNEQDHIIDILESVQRGLPLEIVVADGGSTDNTCKLAAGFGACVISGKPGRARQMNAGAAKAAGTLLLFLHADTILPQGWSRVVIETLQRPGVVAGAFGFGVAGDFRGKRILEWAANWRSRWRQMPYGDQALFLRRDVFEEEGGFADLPIMEDYEFVRRLRGQGRILTVKERARTSARRWLRLGVIQTTLRNRLMIVAYHLGVRPHKLVKIYRRGA